MKSSALLCLAALACLPSLDLRADDTVETTVTAEKEKALLTPAQIDDLLAPIALYPDPLVALILPASTFPTDIVLAARYLKEGKDPEAVEDQTWDDSVKSLARYPEVVKWLDENLAWTQQLGAAFLVQPAAVLNGTQRLRAAAVAAGNLKDTPQQKVVVEHEVIRIVPAEREVIYVPVYDPLYVYRPRVVEVVDTCPGPLMTFSIGYRTGFWLSYYCNWGVNTVVIVNRPYRTVVWHSYPGWSCPSPTVVVHNHVWRPSPVRVEAVCRDFERRPEHRVVARPSANLYVQRGPDREAPHGFARSSNDDARHNRQDAGVTASHDVATAGSAVTNRRERPDRDQSASPAPSSEITQTETTSFSPASAGHAQSGRPVTDRRNPGNSGVARTSPADSVASVPVTPAPERIRPSHAPAVTMNTDAASSAPRLDRRGTRTDTAGIVTPASPAPTSGFGRGQNLRRATAGATSAGTDVSASDAPATTRVQPAPTPSRRSGSRTDIVSDAPAPVVAAPSASSSGLAQRRATNPDQSRGANSVARAETPSPGRTSRQGRTTAADGTTGPLVADNDSDTTTNTRSRR